MDKSLFTEKRAGELVPATTPTRDWAFVPAPLPPEWEFPPSLWPVLTESMHLLGKLDGIGRTLPNPQLLLRPLQQREALRSSSLEGTYATPRELLLFELHPREPLSAEDPANEWREVFNYAAALREGFAYLQDRPLSIFLVRELHTWLLHGVRGHDTRRGQLRSGQVHIGSDRRFVPPPVERLQECLDALAQCLDAPGPEYHPLVWCYLIHYQFEAIHPFHDGNGRVGRLLLALMTCKWCDGLFPWLYMSAFFERYKDEYISKLFAVSTRGDWESWIEFCLRGTVEQARDAISRCERLGRLKASMYEAIERAGPSPRHRKIVEGLFETPVVTIPRAAEALSVTYPTAQRDIEKMVQVGLLQQIEGTAQPKVYACQAIFEIAYDDVSDRVEPAGP